MVICASLLRVFFIFGFTVVIHFIPGAFHFLTEPGIFCCDCHREICISFKYLVIAEPRYNGALSASSLDGTPRVIFRCCMACRKSAECPVLHAYPSSSFEVHPVKRWAVVTPVL